MLLEGVKHGALAPGGAGQQVAQQFAAPRIVWYAFDRAPQIVDGGEQVPDQLECSEGNRLLPVPRGAPAHILLLGQGAQELVLRLGNLRFQPIGRRDLFLIVRHAIRPRWSMEGARRRGVAIGQMPCGTAPDGRSC
jgi:hypothetical protein